MSALDFNFCIAANVVMGEIGALLMGQRDSAPCSGFTVYWVCDSYALVLTRNKYPCNALWSTESTVTFIMNLLQGTSSRLGGEDQFSDLK